MTAIALWERYQKSLCAVPSIGLTLDVSRMSVADGFFAEQAGAMERAFEEMNALERGAIANPSENRMVGHYWLRDPSRAPTPELAAEIEAMVQQVEVFAATIHGAEVKPSSAERFTHVLSIGIGGSALGPMFVADTLGSASDKLTLHFIDNTDPDGLARVFDKLGDNLPRTLCLVISKSGGTPETHNGMLYAETMFREAGLTFARQAVAITGRGSKLDQRAEQERWLARFPMWDWVGGRTSELSAVGLLPAALQGLSIRELRRGAAACDEATRLRDVRNNPAALLALMWHHATGGRGAKDMVVLPYKDRLLLFSRYLQQLVMESLGKRLDRQGRVVEQGIAVYGNKGSTDQHAYVQQLRDGLNNFFVTFIRVLEAGEPDPPVDSDGAVTAGDYLHGFLLGTRQALHEQGRASLTITIPRVDAFHVGVLIALFERAVGFYASLVDINAYDQPGVQAGKTAADGVLDLQRRVVATLTAAPQTAHDLALAIGAESETETVYFLLEHLAANGRAESRAGSDPAARTFAANDKEEG